MTLFSTGQQGSPSSLWTGVFSGSRVILTGRVIRNPTGQERDLDRNDDGGRFPSVLPRPDWGVNVSKG